MRILIPVTGAFHGRLRVRRSSGELDTEGLDRILSEPSARAMSLAAPLKEQGATLVAVHVDKGAGEDILREALAYGADQGILIEGTGSHPSDASTRASTIADVWKQNGPFDAVIGPGSSEFAGFTGTLAAVAGQLSQPVVHGVQSIQPEGDKFRIGYQSIFGTYQLLIPRPCVIIAGDVPARYPTSWGIAQAYGDSGVLKVRAKDYASTSARTTRVRIESRPKVATSTEEVDVETLVRRLRSRSLIPEAGQ